MKKELVPGYQLPGIPGLFHEAFSVCEQHRKALQRRKTAWARTVAWIGVLLPGSPEEHSNVQY